VYTGTISYGLYLLHKIPFDLAKSFHLDRYPLLAWPILLAACYGMAALSWNLLEKPFLRLKRSFEPRSSIEKEPDPFFARPVLATNFAGGSTSGRQALPPPLRAPR
jgi:peptidoglycan/LPS O-acetylase OafA/YrhL